MITKFGNDGGGQLKIYCETPETVETVGRNNIVSFLLGKTGQALKNLVTSAVLHRSQTPLHDGQLSFTSLVYWNGRRLHFCGVCFFHNYCEVEHEGLVSWASGCCGRIYRWYSCCVAGRHPIRLGETKRRTFKFRKVEAVYWDYGNRRMSIPTSDGWLINCATRDGHRKVLWWSPHLTAHRFVQIFCPAPNALLIFTHPLPLLPTHMTMNRLALAAVRMEALWTLGSVNMQVSLWWYEVLVPGKTPLLLDDTGSRSSVPLCGMIMMGHACSEA